MNFANVLNAHFVIFETPDGIYETTDPTGKITKEFIKEGFDYAKNLISISKKTTYFLGL